MAKKEKPPTQGVGVEGFNAFESKPAPVQEVNWNRLVGLPPFGMFLSERHPQAKNLDTHEGIHAYLASIKGHREFELLFSDYCKWHAEKGHWPNETPMGEIKS